MIFYSTSSSQPLSLSHLSQFFEFDISLTTRFTSWTVLMFCFSTHTAEFDYNCHAVETNDSIQTGSGVKKLAC